MGKPARVKNGAPGASLLENQVRLSPGIHEAAHRIDPRGKCLQQVMQTPRETPSNVSQWDIVAAMSDPFRHA
ncbi:hypothetical protein [Methylotetracoccus oryzae]|uniref:hypothetical protein n=1 Tax=Methylotetracoccus oryzae TaxID=1919059 RepID=UPI00111B4A32|nr:hypothetical protein [Methylotetracoccus oryzae]